MDNTTRRKLDNLLNAFRDNPSNSNKYRHSIYALIEELLEARDMEEAEDTERKEAFEERG